MEIKLWDGGLLIHELNAISKMESAFDEESALPRWPSGNQSKAKPPWRNSSAV